MANKNDKFNGNTVSDLLGESLNKGEKESTPTKKTLNKAKHKVLKRSPKPKNTKKNNHKSKPSKQDVVKNQYGILPMSCTLDIGTIGKLDAAKQVLGAHNRDAVVEDLINKSLDDLIKTKGSDAKKKYNLFYKVFMMKHKTEAEKHYKQFYKNGRNSKKNK